LTQPRWRIRLGAEAEKDFARILKYTRNTFGPRQTDLYRATLLEALAALGDGPDVLGSAARDEILPTFTSRAKADAGGISSCTGPLMAT
jgi:toxin ParE1/3/4